MTRKASGKSKAPPIKRQATATKAKLAKVRGCTVAEVERDATQVLARINAANAERLRQQLADTVREAAADTSALAQQVTTAKMWTRYERRKRQQAEQVAGRQLAQAVAEALAHPAKRKKHYPVSRKKLCDIVREHGGKLSEDTVERMDNFKHEPISGYSADTVRISEAAAHLWAKGAAYATNQLKRPGKRKSSKRVMYNDNLQEHNKRE